jgi:hypothetical protein
VVQSNKVYLLWEALLVSFNLISRQINTIHFLKHFLKLTIVLLATVLTACTTPYNGERSLVGGASHTKIDDTTFEVRAGINGMSPSGQLKPMILSRANTIASAQKFPYFKLSNVSISYNHRSDAYNAIAKIQLLNEAIPDRFSIYAVSAQDTYQVSVTEHEAKLLAKLERRRVWFEVLRSGWIFEPVFLDAVSAHIGLFATDSSFVQPGRHRVVVRIFSNASNVSEYLDFDCELKAATVYSPVAVYENEIVSISIKGDKDSASVCNSYDFRVPIPAFRK